MNSRLTYATAAVAAIHVALIAIGCTTAGVTNGKSGSDGGVSPSPSSSSPSTSSGLTCSEVLKCVAACDDTDAGACAQDCEDRTTSGSQTVTNAFAQCLSDNACADADCITSKCKTELDACLADVPGQGTSTTDPPTGATPTGSVPSTLVGTWSSVGLSSGTVWTFEADGTTTTAFDLETGMGSCTYKTALTTSGVTTATADTYVYHRTSGTQVLKNCTSTKTSAMSPADLTYHYTLGTYDDGTPKLTISIVHDDGTFDPSGTELHR